MVRQRNWERIWKGHEGSRCAIDNIFIYLDIKLKSEEDGGCVQYPMERRLHTGVSTKK